MHHLTTRATEMCSLYITTHCPSPPNALTHNLTTRATETYSSVSCPRGSPPRSSPASRYWRPSLRTIALMFRSQGQSRSRAACMCSMAVHFQYKFLSIRNMVLLSELLSVFDYYFFIISGMIKRSYSELKKLPKRATLNVTLCAVCCGTI